jgi:hypothetical protein
MIDTPVVVGQRVERGDLVGRVGDADGTQASHLHFDIARIDLSKHPTDWAGMDKARVQRDYLDPRLFINAHHRYTATTTAKTLAELRVRSAPKTSANILFTLPRDASVVINSFVDGESVAGNTRWAAVTVARKTEFVVGGVSVQSTIESVGDGYCSAKYLFVSTQTPPPQPQPQPQQNAIGVHPALPALTMNKRIGLHVMERIEEARTALDLGCRAFTSLDNIAGAREMRSRGAAVIVRRFIPHGVIPDPREFARAIGLGSDDTLIVMGVNEADNISTSEIEKRFEWDRAFADEILQIAPRCFPVIGSWSMGTPQIENADVAKRFRDTYAAYLNANKSRVGLNYHSYSRRVDVTLPPANVAVDDAQWYEMRFLRFAYDKNLGGLDNGVVLVSDESGVDIGGHGGFKGCGYGTDDFRRWWQIRKRMFEVYPQMYVFNLFQASPRADWAGYDVRGYFDALAGIWGGA